MKGIVTMVTETAVYTQAEGGSSDERWAAWVARGLEHDRAVKKRALAIAVAIAAGLALSLLIVLFR
jgi:hypothetical protein